LAVLAFLAAFSAVAGFAFSVAFLLRFLCATSRGRHQSPANQDITAQTSQQTQKQTPKAPGALVSQFSFERI
jgi:hypothetical protein